MDKLSGFLKSTVCYRFKTLKWYQLAGFLWVAFSHPLYLLLGYYLAMFEYDLFHPDAPGSEFISGNPIVFSIILIFIAELRFKLFFRWHRQLELTYTQVLTRFIKVNRWNFPWILVYFPLLGSMEGNVFVFFFLFTFPVSAIMAFWILYSADYSARTVDY